MIIEKITGFLQEIGIELIEKKDLSDSFLPGVELGPGCIYINYDELKYPGDLLHEAGHLAVTTSQQRLLIGTEELEKPWPTDGEEIAAVLWSYAAAQHLDLSLDILFHENGYKGEAEWLKNSFSGGNYIGLPFLEWAGLAYGPKLAAEKNTETFPKMVKWMRD